MAHSWYTYKGTGDTTVPGNYLLFTPGPGSPVPSCNAGGQLCAIYALNGGPNPSTISNNVQAYIARALAQFTPQPDSPIGARIFVKPKPVA